ncbi:MULTISPECIES: hypothetical protein [Vibrio]|uniref:hypothetical protein n=1 Tax=Vibrio TaxID=662 RepID=UPI00078CA6C1|nr:MULTISPECIES: hypothetical protein [Vibrio]BAU70913.1 hypothetical protein [Vibrio sp. 04Ya108]BBM67830.1 hypothetical protein VA249_44760 [Vibrio alfacsensis]BCN27000.1 hypothetical protein VYA_41920 [Vibrio alfacsensis]
MLGYKYDFYFEKGHTVDLDTNVLTLASPANKGDIIQVSPKYKKILPVTQRTVHSFVISGITHIVGTGTLLRLRKATENDY